LRKIFDAYSGLEKVQQYIIKGYVEGSMTTAVCQQGKVEQVHVKKITSTGRE